MLLRIMAVSALFPELSWTHGERISLATAGLTQQGPRADAPLQVGSQTAGSVHFAFSPVPVR